MKNIIIGIIIFYIINVFGNTLWLISNNKKIEDFGYKITSILKGDAIIFTLNGNCSENTNNNGLISREYFQCNKIQIYISDKLGY